MKLLIVEDEYKIAASLKKGLEQENFIVDISHDGEDGYNLASSEDYDVIILDVMLPKMNGFEICRNLREDKKYTPILMLTAKGLLEDKIAGFDAGADDYLPKPFAFEELLARVRALSRRPKEATSDVLKVANLSLNTKTFEVKRAQSLIQLSQKEFALLEYMIRHPYQILSKDQIIQHVWDYDADVLPNTVEVYIGYLRQKIDKSFTDEAALIHTVRGFGYKLGEKK